MAPQTLHFTDLVAGFPSMAGKRVAITGCTSGMGLVLAETCGRLGAAVTMLNRPSPRAEAALTRLTGQGIAAELVPCDLTRLASVRAAGEALAQAHGEGGVDVLACNAGVMGLPDRATEDWFDVQMQVNHLSHFLLTHLTLPLLERAATLRGEARVVQHSSGARRGPALQARYLRAEGGHLGGDGFPGFGKWRRYQQSKLANLLFTYALAERLGARGSRVKALCAHPGPVDSGLQAKTTAAGGVRLLDRLILARTLKVAQSPEDGTCGLARCCCEPGVESGAFYGPAGRGLPGPAVLMAPERDPAGEALLWRESLAATGIADFFG